MSRLQTLQQQGTTPQLPDAGAAAYLIGYTLDAGPVIRTTSGMHPLTWQDVHAWQHATGISLQAWEARAVRNLSHDYLASHLAALDANCPPPWAPEPEPDDRKRIADGLRSIFSGMTTPAKPPTTRH